MLSQGQVPDARVFPCAVMACSGLLVVRAGQQVHGLASAFGFASDSFVQSSLVHFYVKCNQLTDAQKLFDLMPGQDVFAWSALVAGYARKGNVSETKVVFDKLGKSGIEPNSVSWNGMIVGFNQCGHFLEAVSEFQKMHLLGFETDGTSVSSVLSVVGDLEDFEMGIQIHGYVIKQGLVLDKCVLSALIDMYETLKGTKIQLIERIELQAFQLGSCPPILGLHGTRWTTSGANKSFYALEPFDVGRILQVDSISNGQKAAVITAGPVNPEDSYEARLGYNHYYMEKGSLHGQTL